MEKVAEVLSYLLNLTGWSYMEMQPGMGSWLSISAALCFSILKKYFFVHRRLAITCKLISCYEQQHAENRTLPCFV